MEYANYALLLILCALSVPLSIIVHLVETKHIILMSNQKYHLYANHAMSTMKDVRYANIQLQRIFMFAKNA